MSNQWSGPYEIEALNEHNATLKNHKGEVFMFHTENLSIPSPEILASRKMIPSSRKRPHASTQARKVSLDLINSEDGNSLDFKTSENSIMNDILDGMIEHLDSDRIWIKLTDFWETCKMLEYGEMNPDKQSTSKSLEPLKT